jgi:hypothetical protein
MPSAALPPPRSKTTRSGTAAHGVTPTPALPMDARMLLLQAPTPTTEAVHYRHVLLTTPDRNQRRVTVTTALDPYHQDLDEAEDRPRRC